MVEREFSRHVPHIDPEKEVVRISKRLRDVMVNRLTEIFSEKMKKDFCISFHVKTT